MKIFFGPAFELFRRAPSSVNHSLVIVSALVAQSAALAEFLTLAPDTVPDGSGWLFTAAFGGAGMFVVGLYLYAVIAIIGKYSVVSMSRLLDRFGSGDLSLHFLPGWGDKSEAQIVWTTLNKMNRDFASLIRTVQSTAENITTGSSEIALGYSDLSQRTTEQASLLEQIAASVEQLAATVMQNADHCQQANQTVEDVGGRADEAAGSTQQVTTTMERIKHGTKTMAESISLIEGIAFQTNILALNAAVEAARAGERGQGFAVVAAEVRALARRSSEAAEQIKTLIRVSSVDVNEGVVLVSQAEQAVSAAAGGVRQVVEIIGEVAAASTEQSAGTQMVGEALTRLDGIAQKNAALVEEGAAAAAVFEHEAARLGQTVDVFELQEATSAHAITEGSRETAIKNYALGPLITAFVLPALTLLVKARHAVKMTFTGIPLFTGSLVTLSCALAAMPADAAAKSSFAATALPIVVFGALTVGVYLFMALGTWGQVGTRSLQRLSRKLASGDLSWTVRSTATERARHRESAIVNRALSNILRHFTSVVRQVRASTDGIVAGARDIAKGYSNLSQRTDEQAGTLEEAAASVEQLSATSKQNAGNCEAANSIAQDVGGRAEQAAQAMQRVTATMRRIEESAKRMAEFTRLIEDIAFQTNILALNAAVEAARAGAEGRGFAVVAAEVRVLAQRCAAATEEIKALLQASSAAVAEGATHVSQAEQAVTRCVEGIRQVVEVIDSIATASDDQSVGMRQVAKALAQLETVTQQNAALVEEGAAAATSFEQQASELRNRVGIFRLEHSRDQTPTGAEILELPSLPSDRAAEFPPPLLAADGKAG